MEWVDVVYKILTLIALVGGGIFAFVKWVLKQNKQDEVISDIRETEKEDVKELKETHENDMKAVNQELTIVVYGVLACLKGLKEQGCNGPVTKAINDLEKHLNKSAHK